MTFSAVIQTFVLDWTRCRLFERHMFQFQYLHCLLPSQRSYRFCGQENDGYIMQPVNDIPHETMSGRNDMLSESNTQENPGDPVERFRFCRYFRLLQRSEMLPETRIEKKDSHWSIHNVPRMMSAPMLTNSAMRATMPCGGVSRARLEFWKVAHRTVDGVEPAAS